MSKQALSRREFMRRVGLTGLGLALATTGCQPQTVVVKETVPVPETVVAKETVAVEVTAAPKEAITIRVHARLGEQGDHFTFFAQKFNEEHRPDIFVKPELFSNADYFQKLATMIAGGTVGDGFWLYLGGGFQQYAASGVCAPLDDIVAAENYDLKQFFPECVDVLRWKGSLFALPWSLHVGSAAGVYFNKKAFDDAKVPYPTPDWTWDDLIATAKSLTNTSKGQYGIAGSTYYAGTPASVVRSHGGDLISQDGTKATLTDAKTREGLQIMSDLYNKWKVAAPAGAITDFNQMFASGRIAMFESGYWGIQTKNYVPAEIFGIVPTPKGPTGRGNTLFVDMQSVTKVSKHPRETFMYYELLCSHEAGMDLWQVRGSVPGARPDVWQSEAALKDENFRVYSDMVTKDGMPPALPLPANFRENEYWSAMDTGLESIWLAEKTLDQVIDAAQKACQDVLDKPSLI